MKTAKTGGLKTAEKKYLRRTLVLYLLFTVHRVSTRPAKKPHTPSKITPRKLPHKKPTEPLPTEQKLSRFRTFFHRRPVRYLALTLSSLLAVILIQLLYPANRSLPLSRLESHGYLGFASNDEILESFQNFDQRVVTVHTHTKNLTTSYQDLGVTIRPDQTVREMTDYPLSQRLIPFSLVVKSTKRYAISRDINDSQLSLFVRDVIAQASKQPKDAVVSLNGSQFVISPSEEGYEYQKEALKSQLLRSDLSDRAQLVFAPTILPPAISSDNAKVLVSRMQQRIDNPIVINAESITTKIDSPTLASWVSIVHNPAEKTVSITFDKSKIAASLRPLSGQVDKGQVPTTITYLNGMPMGRREGSSGKVLQFDELVERLSQTTSPVTGTIEANVATIPPKEVIDRTYSRDSSGLQSLLEYWTSTNRGQYSIDLRSLNGRIEANINPNKLFPSVGVYRLFIASMIYGKISANSLSYSTITQTGQNVEVCLDRMVRESNDGCTNALGALIGWGASDQQLLAQGFESTTLTEGAGLTTANDMSDWMTKLMMGSITSKSQADSLAKIMMRSNARSGIPAGSVGMSVASKSGAQGRLKHDVGIIYHPSGTYVLTILSEGSDFNLIADLAREINETMSQ